MECTITSHEEGVYTVRNADWNQDIPVDGKVSFGMTVKYSGEIQFPEEVFLTKECLPVQGDYKIEYKENSRWDNYVNGQIVITNNSEHRIEDWKLDLTSNLQMENVWNAKIISQYEDIYRLNNAGYNQNIEVGETVEFGFVAKVNDEKVHIENYVLNEMTATEFEDGDILEEADQDTSDGDGSFYEEPDEEVDETLDDYWELTYPDGFVFESDDFDSADEYQEYLASRNSVQTLNEASEKATMLKAALNSSVAKNVFYRHQIRYVNEKGDKLGRKLKARQSYCTVDNMIYSISGQSKTKSNKKEYKKNIVLYQGSYNSSSKKIDINEKGYLLKNFAHGQTFEYFTAPNGRKTFLLEGNAKTMWGTNLMLIDYETIEKKAKKGVFKYASTYGKRLTGLGYATKEKESIGKELKRVHAALSSDKRFLALWCMDNKNTNVQVSVYDFQKIKKYLYKKKTRKKFSFETNKAKADKWCLFSKSYKLNDKKMLRPGGSFQSMELSNMTSNGNWYLYICGGNEAKDSKVTIVRMTLNEKEKKIETGKSYVINPQIKNADGTSKDLSGYREIEGCHINGDKLDFWITKAAKKKKSNLKKNPQYIYSIKKSAFKK